MLGYKLRYSCYIVIPKSLLIIGNVLYIALTVYHQWSLATVALVKLILKLLLKSFGLAVTIISPLDFFLEALTNQIQFFFFFVAEDT